MFLWNSSTRIAPLRQPSRQEPTQRLVLEELESRTLLSVCTVDRLTDNNPVGGGEGKELAGDLRYCITNAANGDAIAVGDSVAGTINLAGALPDLARDIRIDGPGAGRLTVRRDTGGNYRIFAVRRGATVSISGLTISNGHSDTTGGGIENDGTLTLSDAAVSGNAVSSSGTGTVGGGGLFNSGSLTITNCTFTGNSASRTGTFVVYVEGGGIYNADTATLTVRSSALNGNSVVGQSSPRNLIEALGGGIYNSGMLTVTGSTLGDNSARGSDGFGGEGGGIATTGGTLALSDSMVRGNSADIVAIWYTGTVSISNSTISENPAAQAAIEGNGTLTVSNSTIANNSGYGIWNGSGTLTVSNSTIANNSGYGFRNNTALTLTNSTIAGNTAGGIENVAFEVDATATVLNSTIADNGGNQLWSGSGFGTPMATATIQLRNTIISGNPQMANLVAVRGGTFVSQGYNLSSDNGGGFLNGPGDLTNIDPHLGPLQDNGGATPTRALLPGSAALNAGDPDQLGAPDQRGVVRSGSVNIGAYQASASAFLLTAPAKVTAGVPFDLTVTVVDPFGQPAVGYTGTVTFSTTDSDSGVVLPADYTFTTDDAGVHTFSDTGLGETTLVTRGQQALAVTDTADGSIMGSAAVKVRHMRHHDSGSPGLPAGLEVASADRFFASMIEENAVVIREWIETVQELGRPIPAPRGRLLYA